MADHLFSSVGSAPRVRKAILPLASQINSRWRSTGATHSFALANCAKSARSICHKEREIERKREPICRDRRARVRDRLFFFFFFFFFFFVPSIGMSLLRCRYGGKSVLYIYTRGRDDDNKKICRLSAFSFYISSLSLGWNRDRGKISRVLWKYTLVYADRGHSKDVYFTRYRTVV